VFIIISAPLLFVFKLCKDINFFFYLLSLSCFVNLNFINLLVCVCEISLAIGDLRK